MTIYNNDGSIAKRKRGPSKRQLKNAHYSGKCHALCSYCIDEAVADPLTADYMKQFQSGKNV